MTPAMLNTDDKTILLKFARQSLECAVNHKPLPKPKLEEYSEILQSKGAAFVTLTENGELRGCIGTLEAYRPLLTDVIEHASDAAMEDYRFPQVEPAELNLIKIEVSRLTAPQPLEYKSPEELTQKLRKGIDGVILKDGFRRATFLPQVWEQLPDVREFLWHLCNKMGAKGDLWKTKLLDVSTYQVDEFHE